MASLSLDEIREGAEPGVGLHVILLIIIMTQHCHSKDEIMMQSCCIAGKFDGELN